MVVCWRMSRVWLGDVATDESAATLSLGEGDAHARSCYFDMMIELFSRFL